MRDRDRTEEKENERERERERKRGGGDVKVGWKKDDGHIKEKNTQS